MSRASIDYIYGSPPTHYSLGFESSLYNREDFLYLKDYPIQSFYAVDQKRQSIEARIHFTIRKQKDGSLRAISLPELPFGSLEYSTLLPTGQLAGFLNFVCEKLANQKVTSLEIRDCVPIYRYDSADLLPQILQNQGFTMIEQVANHHIPVDQKPFIEKVHVMQKRRLRKCIRSGFTFQAQPLSELASVYNFIHQCRAERGWGLSLSLGQLTDLAEKFSDRYQLFSVVDQNQRMAAATVAVQINRNILYNFYPASPICYRSFSPLVYLLQQLYNFAREKKFRWIDLGISTTESLKNFKTRVGGVLSHKKTYLLEW